VTNKKEILCCSKVEYKTKQSLTDTNKWWTEFKKK